MEKKRGLPREVLRLRRLFVVSILSDKVDAYGDRNNNN